ncbi:unnamed protein product [Closterium sp. NIES-54]
MTSSTSSHSLAPARLVPFCALLLLATLLSPSFATSVARGGSGRRVLQEPPASDEIVLAETSALLALNQALGDHPAFSLAGRWSDGPSPNRQGQLSQPCADTWQFVTCDSTGRVIAIDMSNPFLASLNASWARGATVAAVVQQLTARGASQQAVAAAVAGGVVGPLRGEIPWGKMTALQRLERVDLSGNEVAGAAVSAAAALLPTLKHLNLSFNRIDSLPADVTAMTALETLHLDMNRITGSLPSGFSALSRLSALVLGQNQIVGQLPEELGALTDLVTLDLGDNRFQGQPPDAWSQLTNLQVLSLYRLPVTADFPPSWAALSSLSFFSFSSAAASGPFPAFLTQLPNIQHIYLHSNRLSGPLPAAADLWRPSLLLLLQCLLLLLPRPPSHPHVPHAVPFHVPHPIPSHVPHPVPSHVPHPVPSHVPHPVPSHVSSQGFMVPCPRHLALVTLPSSPCPRRSSLFPPPSALFPLPSASASSCLCFPPHSNSIISNNFKFPLLLSSLFLNTLHFQQQFETSRPPPPPPQMPRGVHSSFFTICLLIAFTILLTVTFILRPPFLSPLPSPPLPSTHSHQAAPSLRHHVGLLLLHRLPAHSPLHLPSALCPSPPHTGTQQQPPPSDTTWGSSFFTVCLLIALTILLLAVSFTCCRIVQQRRQQQSDMQQQQQQQQEQMCVDVESEAAAEAHGTNAAILSPNKDSNQPFLAGVALSSSST